VIGIRDWKSLVIRVLPIYITCQFKPTGQMRPRATVLVSCTGVHQRVYMRLLGATSIRHTGFFSFFFLAMLPTLARNDTRIYKGISIMRCLRDRPFFGAKLFCTVEDQDVILRCNNDYNHASSVVASSVRDGEVPRMSPPANY